MPDPNAPIAVIGGGVIGLTSAIRLLEQGFPTTIFAKATSPHTTSDVAAAYWAPEPILEGGPRESWALTSLATFQQLAADPTIGIDIMPLYELADSLAIETFAGALENIALEEVEDVPFGVFPSPWSGLRFIVPRIDVPTYMPWLFQRFLTLGGTLQRTEIADLRTLASDFRALVNCTGLGAQALTGDPVFPIRGQVIRVRKPVDLPPHIISAASTTEVTYIVPRRHDCLLGGTFQDDNYDLQVDPATAISILQRCAGFHPALQHAEIIEHRVGLRPGRAQVRLEVEPLTATTTVIHNYGHGAYGHTLSWGCAAAVVTHVKNLQR
ncbi:MAG: FAD-dependent oxidoreductase [Chloroflexi bacterium]|nr:FAD-dependent oxidoreductase [Chloroflexota bacterium]